MAQMLAVGKDIPRRDAPEKLTGRAQYTGDIRLPGMLYARLVLSQYASAKITSIDSEAARQMPGVAAVFTAQDLEGTLKGWESGSRRLNFLAKDHVVFAGQPVAVVLGRTEAQAEDGAAAVEVSYEPSAVVVDPIKGMQHDAPRVREHLAAGAQEQDLHAAVNASEDEEEHEDLHDNVSNTLHFNRGDVEQGFRDADVVVEDTYKIAGVHQGYLETQSCTIVPDPAGGGVTVYTSTQAQFMTRDEVAKALDLPTNKVRCVAMTVGGGFGAKYVLLDTFVASLVSLAYDVPSGTFKTITPATDPALAFATYLADPGGRFGQNVPKAFADFLQTIPGGYLGSMGYPITPPFIANVQVAGVPNISVVIQAFQRKVLTYTATNPAGFQVEFGNIGQHYYTWRYSGNQPATTPVAGVTVSSPVISNLSDTAVTVTYTTNAPACGTVEYSPTGQNAWVSNLSSINCTAALLLPNNTNVSSIGKLTPATTYDVRGAVKDLNQNVSYSPVVSFTTLATATTVTPIPATAVPVSPTPNPLPPTSPAVLPPTVPPTTPSGSVPPGALPSVRP